MRLSKLRSVKCSNCVMSWNTRDISVALFPGFLCILTKQHGLCCGKYLLKTPVNSISETLSVKMSLDASALKNLYLWCKFQSCLLFIISLLLKNFLTALETLHLSKGRKWFEPFNIRIILLHIFPHPGFWKGNKQNNR